MGILDFFSREAGQERRRALDSLLSQFIPPTARPQFNLLGELNPVVAMERAGQDAQRIGATQGWERGAAIGDMLSNMAGVVAPALALRGAGRPVAQAVEEGLLGFSTSPQGLALGDFVADEFGGVGIGAADAAAERGAQIMDLLRSGRANDVTDDMLDMGDPVLNARLNQWLFNNYDLPMDTASRIARANSTGKTEDFYKGMYPYDSDTGPVRDWKGRVIDRADSVPQELNTIDNPKPFPTFNRGAPDDPDYKIAGVMGRDPEVANNFAAWGDAAVFPLRVDLGRSYVMDAAGDKAGNTHFFESGRPFRDAMRSGDYDSGVIQNTADEGEIAFLLRPENIRSRFARFDPRLAHLKNLNAAFAAGVPLGLLSITPEKEQY